MPAISVPPFSSSSEPKFFAVIPCAKCGKDARLMRRTPIVAFSVEETHTYECTDPACGHQMQVEGRA